MHATRIKKKLPGLIVMGDLYTTNRNSWHYLLMIPSAHLCGETAMGWHRRDLSMAWCLPRKARHFLICKFKELVVET